MSGMKRQQERAEAAMRLREEDEYLKANGATRNPQPSDDYYLDKPAPLPAGNYMLDGYVMDTHIIPGVGKLTDRFQEQLEKAALEKQAAMQRLMEKDTYAGMTKVEYIQFHKECCDRMHKITLAKNADYTGNSKDPFSNFALSEVFDVATTEQGFFIRMTDKVSRIASFIKKGTLQVKDESVEDTLLDLANYCILFAGYLRSKRMKGERK